MKKLFFTIISIFLLFFLLLSCNFKDKSKKTDIGIILPTQAESRWKQDESSFRRLLKNKATIELLFSNNDSNLEKQNVEYLIKKGIKVLIICPYKNNEAIKSVEIAKKAGVTVICYDRLITNTNDIDYFVTFDSFLVGIEQGRFITESLDNSESQKKNNSLFLYVGAKSDYNSYQFFKGAWFYLQPKIEDGTFVVRNLKNIDSIKNKKELSNEDFIDIFQQISTNWKVSDSKKLAKENLSQCTIEEKEKCFILAPNDVTARSFSTVFYNDKNVKSCIITGQDADIESARLIREGKQSMTIWKDTSILAEDSIKMALDILNGKLPKTTTVYNNNSKDIPSKQTAVTVIDKDNIGIILD